MIAFVRGVIAASIWSIAMFIVAGSMSTSTTSAPEVTHHLRRRGEGVRRRDDLVAGADAQGLQRQVQAGGRELTAMHSICGSARNSAKACSKRLAFGPVVIQPLLSVSTTSAISSSPSSGSANGRNGSLGSAGRSEVGSDFGSLVLMVSWRSAPARGCAGRGSC